MTDGRVDGRWVTANMVAGLDGAAAVDGHVGALSGPADQQLFRALRAEADVVLVGAGTVRAERYGPVRLTDQQIASRVDAGRAPVPPIAVVTRSVQLDWTIPLFAPRTVDRDLDRPIIITCADAPAAERATAAEHAEVVVAGSTSVDLALALDALAAQGLARVLTEGGPAVLGELIDLDLLDELRLTLAWPFVGGDPLPIATGAAGGRDLTRFDLAGVHDVDGHVFLRYLTRRARRGS